LNDWFCCLHSPSFIWFPPGDYLLASYSLA
jgi:hypothetical protein